MFTATVTWSDHCAACIHAVLITHSPILMIKPVSSAIGINTSGRIIPLFGVIPAEKCLAAANFFTVQINQRLVIEFELPLTSALRRSISKEATRHHALIHFGLEETVGTAPARLGAVKRHIGAFSPVGQRWYRRPGESATPMLASTITLWPLSTQGAVICVPNACRERGGLGRLFDFGFEDDEFVAAQSARRCHPRRCIPSKRSATVLSNWSPIVVTQRIVDTLEIIEIYKQHRQMMLRARFSIGCLSK